MSEETRVDYSTLYQLDDPLANRPIRFEPHPDNPLTQDETQRLFYGTLQPEKPIRLIPGMGKQVTDVLWSTYPPLICISQKVVDILQSNNFTGWGTYPVELYDATGTLVPGHHGFSVKSYAGKRDYSRSELISIPSQVPGWEGHKVYKGTFFDELKWDGSDVFRIQHAVIIIKKEVMAQFKKNHIINVHFTPLPETETDERIYESLKRSGRL